jgi:hypothetical protein
MQPQESSLKGEDDWYGCMHAWLRMQPAAVLLILHC